MPHLNQSTYQQPNPTLLQSHEIADSRIFEIFPNTFYSPEEFAALQERAKNLGLKVQASEAAERAAVADEAALNATLGNIIATLDTVGATRNSKLISAWSEIEENPAADSLALATQFRPLEDQMALLGDVINVIKEVRLPAARLRKLETRVDSTKDLAEFLCVSTTLSYADTRNKVHASGIPQESIVIDPRTTQLRDAAEKAVKEVTLAEQALNDEKKRQLTRQQTRLAHNLLTRAEVVLQTVKAKD